MNMTIIGVIKTNHHKTISQIDILVYTDLTTPSHTFNMELVFQSGEFTLLIDFYTLHLFNLCESADHQRILFTVQSNEIMRR